MGKPSTGILGAKWLQGSLKPIRNLQSAIRNRKFDPVGFGRIQAPASDLGFPFPVSAEVNGEVLVAGMETAEPIPRSR
jgi:hypothetical protein